MGAKSLAGTTRGPSHAAHNSRQSCNIGNAGEARKAVARLLQLDPMLRVSNRRKTLGPYRHQKYVSQYGDALRKAGLPD